MSNMEQSINAGQTKAMAQQFDESAKENANAAADSMSSESDSCQMRRDQNESFLEQTGDQMMNMAQGAMNTVKGAAQGAAETVKNTLGLDDSKPR